MKTIIFAGSEIDDYNCIDMDYDFIICADKGLVHAQKLKILPNVLIGDFD